MTHVVYIPLLQIIQLIKMNNRLNKRLLEKVVSFNELFKKIKTKTTTRKKALKNLKVSVKSLKVLKYVFDIKVQIYCF